jgi:hypothetical protein
MSCVSGVVHTAPAAHRRATHLLCKSGYFEELPVTLACCVYSEQHAAAVVTGYR